ncbi:MAG: DUF885 domain-containing protein [Acidiferrobacterales bacterium]
MSTESTEKRLDAIIHDYYKVWFRYHPEAAVDAGVDGYGHLLTPYAEDAKGAVVCLNDALMVGLDELGMKDVGADRWLDAEVLYNSARLENEYLLDVEPHKPDPVRMLPLNAIHQLLIRPSGAFAGDLMARLGAIPDYLRGAREYLTARAADIPPVWIQSAVTAARAGAEFLAGLPEHSRVIAHRSALPEIVEVAGRSVQAVREFADFLAAGPADAAAGDFACGRSRFEHLLARRHFLDVSAVQLRTFGSALVEETRRELRALCQEITGGNDVAALVRRIQADHPAPGELLSFYREQMNAASAFIRSRELVTIPANTRLDVVETPLFLRHQVPFAAYSEPCPNDSEQHGFYYVTPAETAEQLAEHNRAGIAHTCVHEAWPGHHLQFVTANLNPGARRLPRLLNASATLYEGWALYCEQLMVEQGFLSRPEQRFLLLKDRLWRALRVVIDVDIHTGGCSLDAAADSMVEELGFARDQAHADLSWYTQSPTVPSCYATGWAMINGARDHLRAQRPDLTLKSFHDLLLSQGSIAMPLVIPQVFGDSALRAALDTVFTAGVM